MTGARAGAPLPLFPAIKVSIMLTIHINPFIIVNYPNGIFVDPSAEKMDADDLLIAIRVASSISRDPEFAYISYAISEGKLLCRDSLSVEDYIEVLTEWRQEKERKKKKRKRTSRLRAEFSTARLRLIKALLDTGSPYECQHEGCPETRHLTVDHIIPLSKGGTNDLSNLQFLCRRHNSSKGSNR